MNWRLFRAEMTHRSHIQTATYTDTADHIIILHTILSPDLRDTDGLKMTVPFLLLLLFLDGQKLEPFIADGFECALLITHSFRSLGVSNKQPHLSECFHSCLAHIK